MKRNCASSWLFAKLNYHLMYRCRTYWIYLPLYNIKSYLLHDFLINMSSDTRAVNIVRCEKGTFAPVHTMEALRF